MIVGPLQALDLVVELDVAAELPPSLIAAFHDMDCSPPATLRLDVRDPGFDHPHDAMQLALMRLNAAVVERSAHPLVLHACAVQTPIGAVVISGASRAGKTSLATAMATLGHPFLADEVVAVEDDDCLRYGKPIALRDEAAAALRHRLPPEVRGTQWLVPSSMGIACDRCPIGAVVFPRFDGDAVARIDALRPAEALERLTAAVMGAQRANAATFHRLERIARRLPALEVVFPSVVTAAELTSTALAL